MPHPAVMPIIAVPWRDVMPALQGTSFSALARSWPHVGIWFLLPIVLGFLGWLTGQGVQRYRGLHARLVRQRAQHAELAQGVHRLHAARPWIRLFAECSDTHRALETRILAAIAQSERIAHQLRRLASALAYGRAREVEHGLAQLGCRMLALAADLADVNAAVLGLQDADRTCARRLAELEERLRALHRQARWPSVGWGADLLAAITALQRQLIAEGGRREAGDPLGALQALDGLAAQIDFVEGSLAERESSLNWLRQVPHVLRRLQSEAERLQEAGHRQLPELPHAQLTAQAEEAIALLTAGRLARSTLMQQRLQDRLQALQAAVIGREETRRRNERTLRALRCEFEGLREQEAQLPAERCRQRFPRRLWEAAGALHQQIQRELADVERLLASAEEANGLEAQRFAEAEATLGRVGTQLAGMHRELRHCETLWRTLFDEEAHLQSRFAGLSGRIADAHAHARQIGMAPDPGLDALLLVARQDFEAEMPALDAIGHALEAAERAFERYLERLRSLDDRLSPGQKWRPGAVSLWLSSPEPVEEPAPDQRPIR